MSQHQYLIRDWTDVKKEPLTGRLLGEATNRIIYREDALFEAMQEAFENKRRISVYTITCVLDLSYDP